MCTAAVRTQMCAHVKDPISICRKSLSRPHSRWYEHTKSAHRGGGGKLLSAVQMNMAARLARGKPPEMAVHCIGTRT